MLRCLGVLDRWGLNGLQSPNRAGPGDWLVSLSGDHGSGQVSEGLAKEQAVSSFSGVWLKEPGLLFRLHNLLSSQPICHLLQSSHCAAPFPDGLSTGSIWREGRVLP